MYPIIASLAGQGSPVGIPLLLIGGFYYFKNKFAKFTCLAALVTWFIWIVAYAIICSEQGILIFPALAIIAWVFISEIQRQFR